MTVPGSKARALAAGVTLGLAVAGCQKSTVPLDPPRYAGDPDASWLQGFQMFVYGRPPLEYLQAMRGSVITWSVYHGGTNDAEHQYVAQLHDAGIHVASNFATMQGSQSVVGDMDFAEQTACQTAAGSATLAMWIQPDPPFLPCNNNHDWLDFLQQRAYDHIGGDADALHIDEVEGIAGHLYYAGFDQACMAGFRAHLGERFDAADLASRFGIMDLASFDYGAYLDAAGAKRISDDPNAELRRLYVRFQLVSRQRSMRALIQNTRRHAGQRYVAFAANTFYLNANKQPFMDDLDFLIYENWTAYPPEGKLLNEHRLARAVAPGKPAAMFPNIVNLTDLKPGLDWAVYLHWTMEAFAAGEYFLVPHEAYVVGDGEQSVSGTLTLPAERLRPYADFMADHWDAHEAEPVANVGVVFPYGVVLDEYIDEGYATPWHIAEPAHEAYLNLTRELDDAHIPYRALYVGDGDLVKRPLSVEDLAGLDLIVVPTSKPMDATTAAMLGTFSTRGGRVLAGDALGASSVRAATTPTVVSDAGPNIALVYSRTGTTLYLHAINYDYDRDTHTFRQAGPVKVTLRLPVDLIPVALIEKPLRAERLEVGQKNMAVQLTSEGNGETITLTIHDLNEYALIQIKPNDN